MTRALILALTLLVASTAAQAQTYWWQYNANPQVPQGWVAPSPCPCAGQYQAQPQYYYGQQQPYGQQYQPPPSYYEQNGYGGSNGCVYGCASPFPNQ